MTVARSFFCLALAACGELPEAPPAARPSGDKPSSHELTPERLAEFAAPALPEDVAARIQAMLDVRGVKEGFVTSDGETLVFNWTVTGSPQIWRQDGEGRFPVQLTGGQDSTTAQALTRDDAWIVVSRDVAGAENPGLYLLSTQGGALKEIQRKDGVRTLFGFLSDDGAWLCYYANDREAASYAVYRYDLKSGEKTPLLTEPGLWRPLDQRGDKLLLAKNLGSLHVELWELDLATRVLTPLLGQGEREDFDATYGRPGTILVRTNKLGEFYRLYELEGGVLKALTPEMSYDVASFAADEAGSRFAYTVNEGGFQRLRVVDTAQKLVPLPEGDGSDNRFAAKLTRDGRFLTFAHDAANRPASLTSYDFKKGRLITWMKENIPEIDPRQLARPSLEAYPARDGTQIPMLVWRPARCEEPCPVVVSFHGGPEGQSIPTFNVMAQLFVGAGFVYVQPNVRGSRGYGKTWLHADNGPKRLEVVSDIEDCALHLRRAWAKDGKAPRLGVTGISYGGYSAMLAMTYFAGAYDAGVAEVGIANLHTFLMNTAPYRRILRMAEYGDPEKDREALVKLSPVTYVDRVKAPMLLIQGAKDPRVPASEAIQIHEALGARGVTAPLIIFPDEGHGTSKRGNQALAIGHTLAFFEKHLR